MKRFLVLEADPDVRKSACRLLTSLGHQVSIAQSNDEVLTLIEKLKPDHFDVALIDGSLETEKFKAKSMDTKPSITALRESGVPVIVEFSGNDLISEQLMKAGCTVSLGGTKLLTVERIAQFVAQS